MGWAKYEEDNREIVQDRWLAWELRSDQVETYNWQHSGYDSKRSWYGTDTAYLAQADNRYAQQERHR